MSEVILSETKEERAAAPKRLYRSRSDRMVAGVCGGLGQYFDVDPMLFRVAFLVLGFTGTGVLAYIVLAIIVPERPAQEAEPAASGRMGTGRTRQIIAWGLVVFGLLLLADNLRLLGFYEWRRLWPIVLVGLGFALLAGRSNKP